MKKSWFSVVALALGLSSFAYADTGQIAPETAACSSPYTHRGKWNYPATKKVDDWLSQPDHFVLNGGLGYLIEGITSLTEVVRNTAGGRTCDTQIAASQLHEKQRAAVQYYLDHSTTMTATQMGELYDLLGIPAEAVGKASAPAL